MVAVAGAVGLYAAYVYFPHVAQRFDRFFSAQSGDFSQGERAIRSFVEGGFLGRGPGEGTIKTSLPESLAKHTDRTITRRVDLIADLRAVADRGYALDSGEYLPDLGSIAVPIRDYTRTVVGSLSIIAPEYRLTPDRVEREVAPIALRAGKDLSSRLGYNA